MTDPEPTDPLLDDLFALLAELTAESADYRAREDDAQRWYNRGYANGMAAALRVLGHGERVAATIDSDPYDAARDQAALPWGRAYEHGRATGERETFEVLGPPPD